ncbi:hypothetical protein BC826DRAFT_1109617 [Russula brevipes]|nr:hypothetical protein BC826DRAFT_1109617 [Russula brevipes]
MSGSLFLEMKEEHKSLLPLSAVVFLFIAAPQPLVVVQSASTTLGLGASQDTIVTHSESVHHRPATRLVLSRCLSNLRHLTALRRLRRPLVFNSLVLSRCCLSSLVSSHHLFVSCHHLISCRLSTPAASPPVVIAQPAVDTPPGALPPHTTLQPILSIQSAPTAAARTVTNDSRHKALGVASGRKQWQYQRQYRLIRLWEKAKLASALAKPDPTQEASLAVAADRAEDANRSMAIINTGQPIPESNLCPSLFTLRHAPPLEQPLEPPPSSVTPTPAPAPALASSTNRANPRASQKRSPQRPLAFAPPKERTSAAACKPNADNLQVSNVPDPPPANSSTLQDLGTCKNKVTCKQKLSVSLAKATPSTPSKAMPPSVIHTATAFVHAVAPTSAPATPPTRGSPPRRPQRLEPSLPRRWLNQGRPAISSNHHKATVFQVARQRQRALIDGDEPLSL